MMKQELLKKIVQKEIIMGVVGLGYVGLPLAVEKAKAGFRTIGFDVQPDKVDMVNEGQNYIGDVVDSELKSLVKNGMLRATTDFSLVASADFLAICVPTPLDEYQQPDISYVRDSTKAIAGHLKPGSIVVLESTTYPGTTEELLLPLLEQGSGLTCGKDFYLGFSPERVDPGNAKYKTKNTPKVVGGVGNDATEVISAVYRAVLESDVLEVSSPRVAEMEKILENTYRNINIGLANEMAIICDKMKIDVWEVIDAAATKPYGFQPFYPGPGLGGHCIPLDPYYLTWKAREFDYHTKLIETAGEINRYMPQYVVERCARILNLQGKTLNGANVLILGVAYKQDINDYRESPALKVIEQLANERARIAYYDPYIPQYRHKGQLRYGMETLTPEQLAEFDLAVILCAHSCVDYAMVVNSSVFVFDTKNATKNLPASGTVERL